MNKEEDRVLHGLYYARQMVGEQLMANGREILWLMNHSVREGANWHTDTGFQAEQEERRTNLRLFASEEERPLRYLAARGLITYERPSASTAMVRITVTSDGADRARRLHTLSGRIGLWYRDHKDGVAGLLAAALVSLVVSLLVNWLTRKQ